MFNKTFIFYCKFKELFEVIILRQEINFITLGTQQAIIEMAEGNPGALGAMMQCINVQGADEFVLTTLLNLDDMNIRGAQIWIAYKDYCASGDDSVVHSDKHVKLFIDCVKKRDLMMVLTVNQAGLKGWSSPYKAVESGASYNHIGRQALTDADKPLLDIEIKYPILL